MPPLTAKNNEIMSSRKTAVPGPASVNFDKTPTEATNSPQTENLSTAKIKKRELIMLSTQLSIMLESGVVLSDALDAIAEQAENGTYKDITGEISDAVKNGESFSKALSKYPRIFSPMFISMVKASEASGTMSEMLTVISSYLEFESDTQKKVKAALTYPFMMAIVALAATGSLMFFVLPRFMKIYESRGAALPQLTQVLVNLSNMLRDFNTMSIIAAVLAVAAVMFYNWMGTTSGRRTIDYIKIHCPILGTMFVDMIVARSMRIMATMLNTGVTLLESVEVVRGSCRNYYFQDLWGWVDDKLRNGYQLSEAIQLYPNNDLIAPQIVQMLKAGEKSGYLGRVSDKISVFYEKKLENSINTATKYIEPLMIMVIGCIIGTIAIALLLPVFRISSIIAH
jgi:type IV pilus assembly protein PilC